MSVTSEIYRRFATSLRHRGKATSEPNPRVLLIPQRRRVHRQVEQRDVIRQRIVQDRGHDVRRQRGQVDHPAHVAVVDPLPLGDLLIDLGNTMSVQTREVEVWNAWFKPNALTDIGATQAEGMTLAGPVAPPTTFGPLESRLYALSVTPNGPPVVNTAFRFEFDLDAPVLRAIGRRPYR